MQLFLFFVQLAEHAPPHAFASKRRPLLDQRAHAAHARHPADQDVKVAGERILQRRQLKEPLHQAVGVDAPLEIKSQFQPVQIRLVAHIRDLADLARFHQVDHLVHNGFDGCSRRDFRNVDTVVGAVIRIARAHADTAAPCVVDPAKRLLVIDDIAAARKIGRVQRLKQVMLRIFEHRDRRFADLREIKRADRTGHADGDSDVGVDKHRWECHWKQRRFLHRIVVVIDHIDGVLVDVPEQLVRNRVELDLRVTRGCVGHIAAVRLAEIALAVDIRMQKRLAAARQAHKRLIDRLVAVGIELHCRADDVGRLGARSGKQAHLIHRVQQLAVRGLKAVDLRDGARNDDAHRIRHIIFLKRRYNRLLDQNAGVFNDRRRVHAFFWFFLLAFCCHVCTSIKMAAAHEMSAISR